jgi:membrane protease YdiL (CAAX protease family)
MADSLSSKRALLILLCCHFSFSFFASLVLVFPASQPLYQPAKLLLSLFSIVSFLLPVLIVRNLFWTKHLFNDKRQWRPRLIVYSVLAMICAFIVMNGLGVLNHEIPIGSSLKDAEIKLEATQQLYLKMDSGILLFYNLFIFGLVPSICEEVFFRSTMQPLWIRITHLKWLGVLITAVIFSCLHFQFLGFLPRLFAGIVIGMIFLFSNNIVLAIICHFLYNSSVVVFSYMEQHSGFDTGIFQKQLLNPYLIVAAIGLMTVLFFQLHKLTYRVTTTP